MIYTSQYLSEQERAAFQRGDRERAELLGKLIDAETDAERIGELENVIDGIRERITEANWRTGKKAELRDLVEAIVAELAEVTTS